MAYVPEHSQRRPYRSSAVVREAGHLGHVSSSPFCNDYCHFSLFSSIVSDSHGASPPGIGRMYVGLQANVMEGVRAALERKPTKRDFLKTGTAKGMDAGTRKDLTFLSK